MSRFRDAPARGLRLRHGPCPEGTRRCLAKAVAVAPEAPPVLQVQRPALQLNAALFDLVLLFVDAQQQPVGMIADFLHRRLVRQQRNASNSSAGCIG
jgi:hypothetical protein